MSKKIITEFCHNLLKIKKMLNRLMSQLISFIQDFPGIFLEKKINLFQRKYLFRDRFGFKFWQYPGDDIRYNWKRKSIGDSIGVRRFIIQYVKPGSVCVDIGACIAGISVPMWSKTGLSGKVISVEADQAKIDRIKANLGLNSFPQDFVVNAAISDREEIRSLRCYPKASGWNTFGNPQFAIDYESFLIDVKCIDFRRLLQVHDLDFVDVVKIDTEGAELLALNGMRPYLIKRQIGCIIFEVNPLMLPGMDVTVSDLISFWDDLPYTLYFLGEDGNISGIFKKWPEGLVGDCIALVKRD